MLLYWHYLKSAKDYEKVIKKLDTFDEVVEAYYTTGNYSIFIKVMTHTIAELHSVLATKIQLIDEIQSTETLIPCKTLFYEILTLNVIETIKACIKHAFCFFN